MIGVRAFGPDPVDVARHVAAYVEGLADSGVVGCAKHFPGHGATDADSHTGLPTVPSSRPVRPAGGGSRGSTSCPSARPSTPAWRP